MSRNSDIQAARKRGETIKGIAARFGISTTRVHQITSPELAEALSRARLDLRIAKLTEKRAALGAASPRAIAGWDGKMTSEEYMDSLGLGDVPASAASAEYEYDPNAPDDRTPLDFPDKGALAFDLPFTTYMQIVAEGEPENFPRWEQLVEYGYVTAEQAQEGRKANAMALHARLVAAKCPLTGT